MAKLYVHECDRCKKRDESNEPKTPRGWVDLSVSESDDYERGDQHYLWCQNCWKTARYVPVQVPPPMISVPVSSRPLEWDPK